MNMKAIKARLASYDNLEVYYDEPNFEKRMAFSEAKTAFAANAMPDIRALVKRVEELEAELRDRTAELHAEQSVMDDTLDMICAPQCGDPFLPERITRVQMLAEQRDKFENALKQE